MKRIMVWSIELLLVMILVASSSAFQKQSNVDSRDSSGRTPMMQEAMTGHAKEVKLYLDKGADVNSMDNDGITVLMWAVLSGNVETVTILLNAGADPLIRDKKGNTALMYARVALGATTSKSQESDSYYNNRIYENKRVGSPNEKEYKGIKGILEIIQTATEAADKKIRANSAESKSPKTATEPVPKPPAPSSSSPKVFLTGEDFNSALPKATNLVTITNRVIKSSGKRKTTEVGYWPVDAPSVSLITPEDSTFQNGHPGTISIMKEEYDQNEQVIQIKYEGSRTLSFDMSFETFRKFIDLFGQALREKKIASFNVPLDNITYINVSSSSGHVNKNNRVEDYQISLSIIGYHKQFFLTLSDVAATEFKKLLIATLGEDSR